MAPRWHLGLLQSLLKYRDMFLTPRFGLVGSVFYLYYLLYELFSPQIEIFGLLTMALAAWAGLLDVGFMIRFVLDFVRATAFVGYGKKKNQWGQIKRQKHSEVK